MHNWATATWMANVCMTSQTFPTNLAAMGFGLLHILTDLPAIQALVRFPSHGPGRIVPPPIALISISYCKTFVAITDLLPTASANPSSVA